MKTSEMDAISTPEGQDLRVAIQRKMVRFSVWNSCLNCAYWRPNVFGAKADAQEECAKFNCKPPLEVIVLSCQSWIPVIPF